MQDVALQFELRHGGDFHPTNRPDEVMMDQATAAPIDPKRISFDERVRICEEANKARRDSFIKWLFPGYVKAYIAGLKDGAIAEHEHLLNR